MTTADAKALLDKVIAQVFGYQNPLSLEEFMQKFTFDIRLPQPVVDLFDGSQTWASSTNPTRFVKMSNARGLEIAGASAKNDFLRPKRALKSIEDILAAWGEINMTTTERYNDCINVAESDNITKSENVWRSQDVHKSRNVLLSDGVYSSEFIVASQRSQDSTFCIRLEDSGSCSNCFNVSWCGNLTNCFFMHDCGDMQDSMFCTNISGKQYCIANMQYTEAEYTQIKNIIAGWILTN